MYSCSRCGEPVNWFAGTYATVMNPHACGSCGTALHQPWTPWWRALVLGLPVVLYFAATALKARGLTGDRDPFEVVFSGVVGLFVALEVMAWQIGRLDATTPAQVRLHRGLFGAATFVWLAIPVAWWIWFRK
jgi:hypothetical protein